MLTDTNAKQTSIRAIIGCKGQIIERNILKF